MPEDQLRNLIDGIRSRMHEELDAQLASMAESHTRAADEARRIAEVEAENRWSAQMETARAAWNARLESDVANVRAEASRTLTTEIARARQDAEEAAAESAAAARRELEEAFAQERQSLNAQLETERTRVSELERDTQRTAADLDSQRQRVSELERDIQRTAADLDSERERMSALEAERKRGATELEEEHRRIAALEAERQRSATELEGTHHRIADLEAERERSVTELEGKHHHIADLEAERQRLLGDLETHKVRMTGLEADRQGLAGELEAQQLRLTELEGERGRIAGLEAERQRLAGELETQQLRLTELEGERGRLTTLEAERERLAGELETHKQRITEIDGERHRITELEAERQRLAGELETHRNRVAEIEGERHRLTELDAERQRASADWASEREQFEAQLESERQRSTQALAEVRAAFERPPAAPVIAGNSSQLVDAIRALDEAATLSDVLSAAVRGAAEQAPHAAVFVLQGTELREWPVAGVAPVAAGPLRSDGRDAGVIAEAMRRSQPAATDAYGSTAPSFASIPSDGLALAVPLVLGGTPVAVLYADGPGEGMTPGTWQDNVQILGRHAAACAASITAVRTAQAMRLMSDGVPGALTSASAAAEDEIHAARRYARLLVSEIKLYNESAVRMGRERKDLLLRLEPEIERARRLYAERVAPSVHGRDALFDQELSQTLADGDHSLLGGPEHQQVSW
jgi:chromosome segregation ATPase